MKLNWTSLGRFLVLGVFFGILIRSFFIEWISINTHVFEPKLKKNKKYLTLKWTYGIRIPGDSIPLWLDGKTPKIGDLVLYYAPKTPGIPKIRQVVSIGPSVYRKKKISDGKVALDIPYTEKKKKIKLDVIEKGAIYGEIVF